MSKFSAPPRARTVRRRGSALAFRQGAALRAAGAAGPEVMAALRNAAIGALRTAGITNFAAGTRHHARHKQPPTGTPRHHLTTLPGPWSTCRLLNVVLQASRALAPPATMAFRRHG